MAQRRIVGFRQDEEQHWVAELECGHTQHVRHTPPWQVRPWVITREGRSSRLGTLLPCRPCDDRKATPASGSLQLAEQVRSAVLQTALAAYADAGLRGLCQDGAWEAAVSAIRQMDLHPTVATARVDSDQE